MHKITSVIPTFNNLPFLKLTVKSVRQNCHYNDMPIFIFAENCTDGTNEWLAENADELGVEYYIETGMDRDDQRGIGGGIDLCVSKVKTEFVNILHSDFWVGPNQDIELLKLYEEFPNDRLIASSFRVQPNIFPNDPPYRPGTVFYPVDAFGAYADDFKQSEFDEWADEFSEDNNINTQPFGAPTNDFQGTVTNYLNPFIQSYGFGLRSTLFGYYMKLDFAWPIEHYNRKPVKVHFTLGYDF